MSDISAAIPVSVGKRRQWLVQNALPVVSSIAFHLGLLAIGWALYQSVRVLLHHQEQTNVADTQYVTTPLTASLNDGYTGPANDPLRRPTQDNIADPAATGWNTERGTNSHSFEKSLNASTEDSDSSAFLGVTATPRHPGGSGTGNGADGGPLAIFGLPHTGGSPNMFSEGPKRARSVAFLCDASGSMLVKFEALKRELSKAISNLAPSQSFTVTFFSGNSCKSLSQTLWVANPQNKLKALNFLEDVTPREETNPIPALELAFQQKPELVFLLTDGDFPDNAAVLDRIRKLNGQHRVRINTIAFVGEADTDTEFMKLLKQIATENSGSYRLVNENDLH